MNIGVQFFLILAVILLSLCWLFRTRKQRNRRTGLPDPSPSCQRIYPEQT